MRDGLGILRSSDSLIDQDAWVPCLGPEPAAVASLPESGVKESLGEHVKLGGRVHPQLAACAFSELVHQKRLKERNPPGED